MHTLSAFLSAHYQLSENMQNFRAGMYMAGPEKSFKLERFNQNVSL